MFVVAFFMKGQPKQTRVFQTRPEAKAFIAAMMEVSDCECVGFDK